MLEGCLTFTYGFICGAESLLPRAESLLPPANEAFFLVGRCAESLNLLLLLCNLCAASVNGNLTQIELGVSILHPASRPMANGPSVPSAIAATSSPVIVRCVSNA